MNWFLLTRRLLFLVQDYHSSWWSYRIISVLWSLFSCFSLKMLFWGGSMQKYWLQSSNKLAKVWINLSQPLDCSVFLVQDQHSSWLSYRRTSVLWGLLTWFPLKMLFWGGSMQTYWLRNSKPLVKDMNQFLSTSRLLCIFGTRLSFILMKLQTHQCTLEAVFMILSKTCCFEKVVCKNIGWEAQNH